MIYNSIIETIGNTPLVRLNTVNKGIRGTILAKVEYFNPGNSTKDRMALKMVEDAEKAGILKPGGTIIEGTSGNTGMGIALAAIAKGYKCIFTMADKQSQEKINILKAVGAEVVVCPTNVEPEDPRSYYSVAKKFNEDIPNSFYPNQYDNASNAVGALRDYRPGDLESNRWQDYSLCSYCRNGWINERDIKVFERTESGHCQRGHRHLRFGV